VTYEVVGVLGRGGMALVELAVDEHGNAVARKRIPLTGSGTDLRLARQRLRREAEILSRLAHPAIVPVLDVEDDGADVVIVMPAYAESLADRVRDLGPLEEAAVATLGRQLLSGLVAAHRAGVVHRDIKPANVLFSRNGQAALADFGVASTREHTPGLTVDGTVVGTPAWMAPEQARGDGAGPPADVFALAATLLYAATGVGPYGRGEPGLLLWRAGSGQVAPLPATVPPSLAPALTAMLDPDPTRRPSAAAVLGGMAGTQVLPAVRPVPPTPAVPPMSVAAPSPARARARSLTLGAGDRRNGEDRSAPDRALRRRRRWPVALAALVAVAVAVGAGVALADRGGSRRAAPTSTPTSACVPLAYQACGQSPAPHTDGSTCSPGWYDLDGNAADGCEARSDYVAGLALTSGTPRSANLVPANATDIYDVQVSGNVVFSCLGSLRVTLTAPPGVSDQVQVLHDGQVVGQAVSTDAEPATATVHKPNCLGSDREDLTVQVTDVAGTSASDFTLSRAGGW
jgi:tRNA A-37 threonylcarbamoyl transferase component Bud32